MSVSGNANVSGRLSYGTLAANSPHFLETAGQAEPLCIKSSIGKYVGCMVDENFEFECRIDDRCSRKYLDSKLAAEVGKLNEEINKIQANAGQESPNGTSNLITGNAINEQPINETTEINEEIDSKDKQVLEERRERLSRIKDDVKGKSLTVKEAIEKLKLEDLKEIDIDEIESEEDAQYAQPAKPKEKAIIQQVQKLDYMEKINGSIILRLG